MRKEHRRVHAEPSSQSMQRGSAAPFAGAPTTKHTEHARLAQRESSYLTHVRYVSFYGVLSSRFTSAPFCRPPASSLTAPLSLQPWLLMMIKVCLLMANHNRNTTILNMELIP